MSAEIIDIKTTLAQLQHQAEQCGVFLGQLEGQIDKEFAKLSPEAQQFYRDKEAIQTKYATMETLQSSGRYLGRPDPVTCANVSDSDASPAALTLAVKQYALVKSIHSALTKGEPAQDADISNKMDWARNAATKSSQIICEPNTRELLQESKGSGFSRFIQAIANFFAKFLGSVGGNEIKSGVLLTQLGEVAKLAETPGSPTPSSSPTPKR